MRVVILGVHEAETILFVEWHRIQVGIYCQDPSIRDFATQLALFSFSDYQPLSAFLAI